MGADAIRALSVEAGLPINVVQGVSETIPFKDGEFDVLFARAALHHALDLDSTCEELFRVLKPGGRIIVVREHVISRASDLDSFLRAHPLHDRYGGENAYLLKRYVSALKNAGFRIRRVIAPLESAINLAPHTMGDVQNELAIRCGRMIPGSVLVATLLLGTPGLRWVVRQAIGWFDDRPGRLYSFVADRP